MLSHFNSLWNWTKHKFQISLPPSSCVIRFPSFDHVTMIIKCRWNELTLSASLLGFSFVVLKYLWGLKWLKIDSWKLFFLSSLLIEHAKVLRTKKKFPKRSLKVKLTLNKKYYSNKTFNTRMLAVRNRKQDGMLEKGGRKKSAINILMLLLWAKCEWLRSFAR